MSLDILYYGNPILRTKAKKIEKITDEIKKFAHLMLEKMDSSQGVGLAAKQVGSDYNLFVLRKEKQTESGDFILTNAKFYINPIVSNLSKNTIFMLEGCLSFPGIHLEIERSESIHIEALDLDGKQISEDVKGFGARVILHEYDHLQGMLFIDRAKEKERRSLKERLRELKKIGKKQKNLIV